MTDAELQAKLDELLRLPSETEWVEFKHNNENPQDIGEYLSALSNGAALHSRRTGYLVWGIEDGTHAVLGTKFRPKLAKKGNENLESWLLHQLNPADRLNDSPIRTQRQACRPLRRSGCQFDPSPLQRRSLYSRRKLQEDAERLP